MRSMQWLVLFGVFLLISSGPGCKSATGGAQSGKPTYLQLDPGFAPGEATRLPIIGFENTSGDADAPNYLFHHLEDALLEKPAYTLLGTWAVERDVRRKKLQDQYDELGRQWHDTRSFDSNLLREFGAAFGVDYVMGVELSEWDSVEIDVNVEGYSHSDVAAMGKIFDVQTGKVVWEAKDRVELKSAHWDPSTGAGRKDELGIVRGQSRVVPQPPPIDDAASRLAINLMSSLP